MDISSEHRQCDVPNTNGSLRYALFGVPLQEKYNK